MARPIPGTFYTVQRGETFKLIAKRAYGIEDKWILIQNANQLEIKKSDTTGILEGETLFIPIDPDLINIRQQ